jgi:hypothetical protein
MTAVRPRGIPDFRFPFGNQFFTTVLNELGGSPFCRANMLIVSPCSVSISCTVFLFGIAIPFTSKKRL